jgi:hypothetical protein
MPRWITLSLTDLNEFKVAELVEALRTEALAEAQGDPMPGMIGDTARELRAAVAFSGKYKLDANPETIPASLRALGAKKVVRELKGRLEIALKKKEETDDDIYEKRLVALKDGKWPVEEPDTVLSPVDVQPDSSNSPRIIPKRRQATRETLNGS